MNNNKPYFFSQILTVIYDLSRHQRNTMTVVYRVQCSEIICLDYIHILFEK